MSMIDLGNPVSWDRMSEIFFRMDEWDFRTWTKIFDTIRGQRSGCGVNYMDDAYQKSEIAGAWRETTHVIDQMFESEN